MTPDQLVAAVQAALDNTERVAREADAQPDADDLEFGDQRSVWGDPNGEFHSRGGPVFAHVLYHPPAAVLRRAAADRRVLKRHQENTDTEYGSWCRRCCVGEWPCDDLLDLADRLGIDPEGSTP